MPGLICKDSASTLDRRKSLRLTKFINLRDDKDPRKVVREIRFLFKSLSDGSDLPQGIGGTIVPVLPVYRGDDDTGNCAPSVPCRPSVAQRKESVTMLICHAPDEDVCTAGLD
jgi:hypothetical protein